MYSGLISVIRPRARPEDVETVADTRPVEVSACTLRECCWRSRTVSETVPKRPASEPPAWPARRRPLRRRRGRPSRAARTSRPAPRREGGRAGPRRARAGLEAAARRRRRCPCSAGRSRARRAASRRSCEHVGELPVERLCPAVGGDRKRGTVQRGPPASAAGGRGGAPDIVATAPRTKAAAPARYGTWPGRSLSAGASTRQRRCAPSRAARQRTLGPANRASQAPLAGSDLASGRGRDVRLEQAPELRRARRRPAAPRRRAAARRTRRQLRP